MKFSGMLLLAMATIFSPFVVAANAPPTKGLLITRTSSEQWEVRLIAGGQAEQFSFQIDSDMPYSATSRVGANGTTSASLGSSKSIDAALSADAGSVDGVNFSVSPDAKLCIRDEGNSGVNIYLGDDLANAMEVTAPVALTSADACGDAVVSADAVTSALVTSGRKYHVGHWIVMGRGDDSQAMMQTAVKPGVVGIMKRYTWRSLEPSQGVYQFGEIKSDLAWAAAHGMHLIVMIEYKTFRYEKAGPAYLDKYEGHNNLGGFSLVLWNPTVTARYNALTKALGAQVDSNKNFEGIATQESAMSMDSSVLKQFGYTPEKYRDALISMLSNATVNLKTSRVFWLMNFIVGNQTYIGAVANAVKSKGVVMGGPDVWPDNKSLQSRTYPYYTQFYGKMPLFGQVENVCYSEPHMTSGYKTKYWTMLELFNYARTKLHVNYMFWVRVTRAANAQAYDWTDALPVIAAHPQFN